MQVFLECFNDGGQDGEWFLVYCFNLNIFWVNDVFMLIIMYGSDFLWGYFR